MITWRDHGGDDIYAQKFDAAGARVDGQVQISSPATYSDDAPVVTGLAGNAFVVAWHALSDVSSSGIFQRVVGEPQAFAHGVAPQIVDLATRVSFQENALNAAPQLIDAGIGLLDGDSANFAGGRADVSFLTTYGDRTNTASRACRPGTSWASATRAWPPGRSGWSAAPCISAARRSVRSPVAAPTAARWW